MASGHRNPITTAEAVVAELRSLAEDSDGWLKLAEGIPDERMDSWPIPALDDLRTLPRAGGGFEAGSPLVNFNHPTDHQNSDASFTWQAWDRGSPWVLNPDSGRWGDVFAIVEHQDYESSRIPLAWRTAVLRVAA